jgi:hypothetical protein
VALPKPCEMCGPDGYWVEDSSTGGVTRCVCQRGRALAAYDLMRVEAPTLEVEPQISEESAALGVSMLTVMKFFPTEEGARIVIADELRSMCADDSQVLWLGKRMGQIFTEWPGLPALRAVFWSKYIPLDRRPAENEALVFPDGVPPELRLPVMAYRSLPPGSQDAGLDSAIRKIAAAKRLG